MRNGAGQWAVFGPSWMDGLCVAEKLTIVAQLSGVPSIAQFWRGQIEDMILLADIFTDFQSPESTVRLK